MSHWCRIQGSLALSSGEAEMYASQRDLANMMVLWNLAREMRGDTWGKATLYVDASVCKSILLRKGSGSIKHLEVKDLWCQRIVKDKGVAVKKIDRTFNSADALASPCSAVDLWTGTCVKTCS